jgi:hypothetical protein
MEGNLLRKENEIREFLKKIMNDRLNGSPYPELKSIAWHGTKQALEWVLEEKETPLSYK